MCEANSHYVLEGPRRRTAQCGRTPGTPFEGLTSLALGFVGLVARDGDVHESASSASVMPSVADSQYDFVRNQNWKCCKHPNDE